ncbi:MAG: oligosaccharide flippase family protein [Sulfuricellaceae bacterium]|nr:oligosaccharide flippase family protein [Sulfuricellaceae bacterium]
MVKLRSTATNGQGLGQAARSSILWGGGFTLLRDVAQFATMLVLVRLLTPEAYGSMALAQSIIGLVSVASFQTMASHALQLRDPADVDWQAHFTAGIVLNSALYCLTLLVAWALYFSERYHGAAWPLAGLATVLLVDTAGALRIRMLETQHNWKRLRTLLTIGTSLGLVSGLIVALLGGGVWALVIQVPLFGLPAAIDLLWLGRWRPDGSWSWVRYRETAQFGANRMGAAAVTRGRQTFEQTVLAGVYDFAVLGVFTRTVGLATLIAGRIGSVAMMSLYPVVTRAEQRSPQFQRMARLVLQGVCWTTIPAAVLLALCAEDIVALLYGPKWLAVIPLLPLAVAGVALAGIASTLSSLLLAGNEIKTSLQIDLVSACIAVVLALWLVPVGIEVYLAALAGHGLFVVLLTLAALVAKSGIALAAIRPAFLPAVVAGAGAVLAVEGLRLINAGGSVLVLRLATEVFAFALVYIAIMRIGFSGAMRKLLEVVPGGERLMKMFSLSHNSTADK